jgi:HD-GYP domain-containing protein (c-di-GMP phosphodiesterase class II)
LAARITALADVYDALTSHRPYRPALSHAEAREWIVTHYGTQFDPEVVEAFVAREQDFIRLSQTANSAAREAESEGPAGDAIALSAGSPPVASGEVEVPMHVPG